ncbi:MAG: ABC transporter substrate-binding protein [Deltaproteobacteria bacterium]|nr:ABC transporter substrate-binding protein [Deltaproteobacteria bacterium]
MTSGFAQTDAIRIGILQEPKTLNVWLASDAWSSRVLSQIYQPLYIREPKTLDLIPWLAADQPKYDPTTLSYTVTLRLGKWSDGSSITAADVMFTGRLIKTFRIPRYISNWDFIEKIESIDSHTVRFVLKHPEAIFTTRTLTTPIVQKKRWAPVLEGLVSENKSLLRLLNHEVTDPVSSGPFVLKQWKKGAFIYLEKNPHFFGQGKDIAGYRLGPHIEGIVFKVYGTTDAAVLALKKGSIDFFWWGLQPGYLPDLEADPNVRIFSSQKSALYYVGLNLRKAPFNDIRFRKAMATLIDKDFIVTRILHNYAIKMDSIVPTSNTFWYCPDVPRYGEGLDRKERIRQAYRILKASGYTWENRL